jgi:thymidylate synthase ThyX
MPEIAATVVEDSVSPQGKRITTLHLVYPRWILAQLNTHRMFSRNTRSSRAIPVERLLQEVETAPVVPLTWRSAQKGMVAGPELPSDEAAEARKIWIVARNCALTAAKGLADLGVAKEITNRLLEPFAVAHTLVTATEWDNFFELRLAPDAQPEIRALAQAMKAAMGASVPVRRDTHMPYVTPHEWSCNGQRVCMRISAARCARISYKPFDGSNPDPVRDEDLARGLLRDRHMSPFEHQAFACRDAGTPSRNFRGWTQYRALLEDAQGLTH